MLRKTSNFLPRYRRPGFTKTATVLQQPHRRQHGVRRRLLSSPAATAKDPPPPPSSSSSSIANLVPAGHPGVGKMMTRAEYLKLKKAKGLDKHNTKMTDKDVDGKTHFIRAGLPFLLFSFGAWWVVTSALDGKMKEKAFSRREVSQSERQALMQEEHDTMMDKLTKAAKKDFDNTKRIERPEEILARRKAERDKRNAWYRRYWRYIKGESS